MKSPHYSPLVRCTTKCTEEKKPRTHTQIPVHSTFWKNIQRDYDDLGILYARPRKKNTSTWFGSAGSTGRVVLADDVTCTAYRSQSPALVYGRYGLSREPYNSGPADGSLHGTQYATNVRYRLLHVVCLVRVFIVFFQPAKTLWPIITILF